MGVVVVDQTGRTLALERTDIPDAWQLPQGGIEPDEEPTKALWRELREETGLTDGDLTFVAEVPEWLGYELPPDARTEKTGRGQVHKWFVLRAKRGDLPVALDGSGDAEFRSWRWVDLGELAEEVVPFRRAVYRRLAEITERLGA